MSLQPPTQPFLSPDRLITRSRVLPGRSGRGVLFAIAVLIPLVLYFANPKSPLGNVFRIIIPFVFVGLLVLWTFAARVKAEAARREAQTVDALEELIQLRRWQEAAEHAQRILGDAMLVPERRMQALMCLASILLRYHRFEDAQRVHEYLLNPADGDPVPDGSTAHSIKVARAMALLRDDRLVDADRAITELRRDVTRARDQVRRLRQELESDPGKASSAESPERSIESAGLILVELYRDVKTGHFEEAIALFESRQKALRDQLAHRCGDAWVLAARAYDGLNHPDRAADAYGRATALVPSVELHRRYPETADLETKYPGTVRPRV